MPSISCLASKLKQRREFKKQAETVHSNPWNAVSPPAFLSCCSHWPLKSLLEEGPRWGRQVIVLGGANSFFHWGSVPMQSRKYRVYWEPSNASRISCFNERATWRKGQVRRPSPSMAVKWGGGGRQLAQSATQCKWGHLPHGQTGSDHLAGWVINYMYKKQTLCIKFLNPTSSCTCASSLERKLELR